MDKKTTDLIELTQVAELVGPGRVFAEGTLATGNQHPFPISPF
jgi:hypothetical protein